MTLIERAELETVIEMEEYEYSYVTMKKERMRRRLEAIHKIAENDEPRCAICGCPHAEILQFGHFKGDGNYHRKKGSGGNIVAWVIRETLEVVREKVQLECAYCNYWHAVYGEYPPPEKRPQWISAGPYPHVTQTTLEIFNEEK